VVNFREIKEEKRKTTIQITINVERIQIRYSYGVNLKDNIEILIRDYRKKAV